MNRKAYFTLLLMVVAMLFSGCSKDDSNGKGDEESGTRRTVIIYMSAQNSLGFNKYSTSEMQEILSGCQSLNKRDQIVLYVDDNKAPRIYRYYRGCKEPQLLKQYSTDLNSSDPATLGQVLSYVLTNYPSESYGLVLWSHANGWLPSTNKDYSNSVSSKSFSVDVGTGGDMENDVTASGKVGAQMDISDMAAAIENSGIKLSYIFCDACLMQGIEDDYALRHCANYVIASPMSTPAIGPNYASLIYRGLFSSDPADIARTYYSYMTSLPATSVYHDFGLVISCVRTAGLDSLAAVTRRYISATSALTTDAYGRTAYNWPDMSGVAAYADYSLSLSYMPHFYDMAAAMKKMLPSSAYKAWRAVLDDCITYKAATDSFYLYEDSKGKEVFGYTDKANYCGISAFIPTRQYSLTAAILNYYDWNEEFRSTAWYKDAGWEEAGW